MQHTPLLQLAATTAPATHQNSQEPGNASQGHRCSEGSMAGGPSSQDEQRTMQQCMHKSPSLPPDDSGQEDEGYQQMPVAKE
jgi:hypothetical protein